MKLHTPPISVLMPVYNSARHLPAAMESVLGQDFDDFEFVIVDDGSTDASLKLLQRYAAQDQRIRLISRPNTGIVGALNDGLAAARGEFVARMDSDDLCMPSRFTCQLEYLQHHQECLAVGSRILLIDEEGWPIRDMCTEQTHEEIDAMNLRGGGAAMNHPAVMFRTAVVRNLGGYRQELIYAEDLDLWLRLAEIGRLCNLPQALLHYRMHANSIGHARSAEQHRKWRMAAAEAKQRRGYAVDARLDAEQTGDKACSEAEHHIRWAWWALMAGNVRTARKHARAGVRLKPWSIESWRLACCAARGH